jgi:hypothetical protein
MVTGAVMTDYTSPVNTNLQTYPTVRMSGNYAGICLWGDNDDVPTAIVLSAKAAKPDAVIYEVSPPEKAIVKAISLVGPGDSILWAGPGHQDYRDIRGVRTPYSARALAREALRNAGWK